MPKPKLASCSHCYWRGTEEEVLRSILDHDDTACPKCSNGTVTLFDIPENTTLLDHNEVISKGDLIYLSRMNKFHPVSSTIGQPVENTIIVRPAYKPKTTAGEVW